MGRSTRSADHGRDPGAVLVLLGPAIFLPNREPFNRLMEFLELVLGRSGAGRREPPAAG